MRLIYDDVADAAYLYLGESTESGRVRRSDICDAELVNASIIVEFDEQDHLIGVELLGVSRLLAPEVLSAAERALDVFGRAAKKRERSSPSEKGKRRTSRDDQ